MMDKKSPRKVKVSQSGGQIDSLPATEPHKTSSHAHSYVQEVQIVLEEREHHKIVESDHGKEVNMTPNEIPETLYTDKFRLLTFKIEKQLERIMAAYSQKSIVTGSRGRSSVRIGNLAGVKQSIEDVILGVAQDKIKFEEEDPIAEDVVVKSTTYTKPLIKIVLRKCREFLLYCQSSTTALRGTSEGDEAEKDNRQYEYMTMGKGKVRQRSNSYAQTDYVLLKTREVNTEKVGYATIGSYVSHFEMYDTLHDQLKTSFQMQRRSLTIDLLEEMQNGPKPTGSEIKVFHTTEFQHTKMLMGRALTSNINERGMRRFRNLGREDRFSKDATYSYSVDLLFRCIPAPSRSERKPVCDISFCATNGDLFAVAYGIFTFSTHLVPSSGDLFIWSIKNVCEPERCYYYDVPVTAVCFSPYIPNLLAVGFFDGAVEVRDITTPKTGPIAVSQRSTSPNVSPVVAIRWIKQSESNEANEMDPFLTLSQDGSIIRYRIIKSPYLLSFIQMVLQRVVGHPEGILVPITSNIKCEANRNPQGINMVTHPQLPDLYYVLTDEGCIHKCSTNDQLGVLKCHESSVLCMEFSPWSPKLFLTCGNDWCIRIWIEGILKPLIELRSEFNPIHGASWSPTHSTVIVSLTRTTLDIWDIRRNILKPMASHNMDSSYNTVFRFSKCGYTVLVGNERGNLLFQAINNMPFPPHFQYDELEKAIYKAVSNDQEVIIELRSIGFFGYPKKMSMKMT